jgi:hypothetical protein
MRAGLLLRLRLAIRNFRLADYAGINKTLQWYKGTAAGEYSTLFNVEEVYFLVNDFIV